jgi:hypothetical protein
VREAAPRSVVYAKAAAHLREDRERRRAFVGDPEAESDCEAESESDDDAPGAALEPPDRAATLRARGWLAGLGFSGLSARDDSDGGPILKNPLVNGALICDVALALAPGGSDAAKRRPDYAVLARAVTGRRPSSVRSAKARTRAALRSLREHTGVDGALLGRASKYVLGGNRVWTLLCRLASDEGPPRGPREVEEVGVSFDLAPRMAEEAPAPAPPRPPSPRRVWGSPMRDRPKPSPPPSPGKAAVAKSFRRPWRLPYGDDDRARLCASLRGWLDDLGVAPADGGDLYGLAAKLADGCVEINHWFGTSRPNFEIL